MVFGMAGLACTYVKDDKSRKIHQGRSGSDCCEHTFAKIRQINPNSTIMQASQCVSKISAQGAVQSNMFTGKRGKMNAAGTSVDAKDFFGELAKRPKKKKKKKK